jgi:hypothetical protein
MTTRQYARLLAKWAASIGLDPSVFGIHSLHRTKATLIYRRQVLVPDGSSTRPDRHFGVMTSR